MGLGFLARLSKPSDLSHQKDASATTLGEGFCLDNHYIVNRGWHVRFWEQFRALSYKNGLVSWRNLRATLLRLLSPLFFMFLLWLINIAIRRDNPHINYIDSNPDPTPDPVGAIPTCGSDMYAHFPCWDFLYTPNNSDTVNSIVTAIRDNNPGRPIASDSVLGFADMDAVNEWLSGTDTQTLGAYHFTVVNSTAIDFLLQVNFSARVFRGDHQDPNFFAQVPLQVAGEREIARYLWQTSGANSDDFSWNVSTSQFAHPTTADFSIISSALGLFVFAANLFGFALLLSAVVMEKEVGLRQALKTMGLLDSAFWVSWWFSEMVMGLIFSFLIIGFGAAFGFDFFTVNDFGLLLLLFFLFQWSMASVAFMLTTFIKKASTAVYVGFVIFIVGWICQIIVNFGFPYTPDEVNSVPAITVIFALLPWCLLAKATMDLGTAVGGSSPPRGIGWAHRSDYCLNIKDPNLRPAYYNPNYYQDFECVLSIDQCLIYLTIEAIVYFLIAIWLDNVLPNEQGVRKNPLYFLRPSYWWRKAGKSNALPTDRGKVVGFWRRLLGGAAAKVEASAPSRLGSSAAVDPDVASEELRMRDLFLQRTEHVGQATPKAVEVFGLTREFKPGFMARLGYSLRRFFCCYPLRKKTKGLPRELKSFWAIKGSWLGIEPNQLFCLLGPNGAGKTTTINCLTGVLPMTGGEVLIYGERLKSPGGADRIRSIMGVCQQFDVLWPELTGREHMTIYGMVKGLPKVQLREQVDSLLDNVKLTYAAHVTTGAYSGGMRRRLSVALALLGDPLLVYLDEPTTGMDPISRRHVWDVIEASKRGRAIVLTTHSMEEADILGDVIAIMARGRLRALGTSLRLKQRFGAGYQLSISVFPHRSDSKLALDKESETGDSSAGASVTVGALKPADEALLKVNGAAVKELFQQRLGLSPVEESRAYMHFLVPREKEADLPAMLEELEDRRVDLGITDLQIALTSLEEVFLTIARQAEIELAEAEGRATVNHTLAEGTVLEVPMGEESAHGPDGKLYAVKWAQDEAGNLLIFDVQAVRKGEEEEVPTTKDNKNSSVDLPKL